MKCEMCHNRIKRPARELGIIIHLCRKCENWMEEKLERVAEEGKNDGKNEN